MTEYKNLIKYNCMSNNDYDLLNDCKRVTVLIDQINIITQNNTNIIHGALNLIDCDITINKEWSGSLYHTVICGVKSIVPQTALNIKNTYIQKIGIHVSLVTNICTMEPNAVYYKCKQIKIKFNKLFDNITNSNICYINFNSNTLQVNCILADQVIDSMLYNITVCSLDTNIYSDLMWVGCFTGCVKNSCLFYCELICSGSVIHSFSVKSAHESGYVGGFIGYVDVSSIIHCCKLIVEKYNIVSIKGHIAGGFIGYITDHTDIEMCSASYYKCIGVISINGELYTGGFIGYGGYNLLLYRCSVHFIKNYNNIYIQSNNFTGGFIGVLYSDINQCTAEYLCNNSVDILSTGNESCVSGFVCTSEQITLIDCKIKYSQQTDITGNNGSIISHKGTLLNCKISVENFNIKSNVISNALIYACVFLFYGNSDNIFSIQNIGTNVVWITYMVGNDSYEQDHQVSLKQHNIIRQHIIDSNTPCEKQRTVRRSSYLTVFSEISANTFFYAGYYFIYYFNIIREVIRRWVLRLIYM